MERLTERHYKESSGYYMKCSETCHIDCGEKSNCEEIDTLVDRLGAIEDILGNTYDLDNLKKMVEAFDNHRVLLIPKEGIKWLYRFGPDGIDFAKAPKEELKSPRVSETGGDTGGGSG